MKKPSSLSIKDSFVGNINILQDFNRFIASPGEGSLVFWKSMIYRARLKNCTIGLSKIMIVFKYVMIISI